MEGPSATPSRARLPQIARWDLHLSVGCALSLLLLVCLYPSYRPDVFGQGNPFSSIPLSPGELDEMYRAKAEHSHTVIARGRH
jgi:hypothetical protein